jgi:hypothetical protein
MKRLVWLLLAVFGTLLAQVSPVDLPMAGAGAKSCSCCEVPGACGMPDCVPAPASAQPVFDLQSPARTARASVERAAPAPRGWQEKFYVQFLPRATVAPALPAARAVAHPASVPLFQEHCSLLI